MLGLPWIGLPVMSAITVVISIIFELHSIKVLFLLFKRLRKALLQVEPLSLTKRQHWRKRLSSNASLGSLSLGSSGDGLSPMLPENWADASCGCGRDDELHHHHNQVGASSFKL